MKFDESSAECQVLTYKDGILSPLGHDLTIAVGRFTIAVDGERVEASFDAGSLRVLSSSGGAVPLSQRDKQSIEETIAREILKAQRHPRIEFRGTVGESEIRGQLTLVGKTREIVCRHRVEGARHTAEARLHQPDFGISPYRAMLGALRLKADLDVRVSLRAE
jgi:polyisoprenoid-binding protein YceI